MEIPIPPHADRILLGGETAWIWETRWERSIHRENLKIHGWSILHGPYQIDLENLEGDDPSHTVDWSCRVPSVGEFSGGLAQRGLGHLGRPPFLKLAEDIFAALRRK